MALPQIVAAIAAVVAYFVIAEVKDRVTEVILRETEELGEKVGRVAIKEALNLMGIQLDLDGDVNESTITEAINIGVLGGQVKFSNLFDKQAVQADCKRIALELAAQQFGYDSGAGMAGLTDKVVGEVLAEIQAEIEAGSGDYLQVAKDLPEALRAIKLGRKDDWNTPIDMSNKGFSNRARQAKYRAQHKRVWVAR